MSPENIVIVDVGGNWFQYRGEYVMQDPTNNTRFASGKLVKATETLWVKEQVKASAAGPFGLFAVDDPFAAPADAPAPAPSPAPAPAPAVQSTLGTPVVAS